LLVLWALGEELREKAVKGAVELSAAKPKRGCASALALLLLAVAAPLAYATVSYGLSWWSGALALGAGLLVVGLFMVHAQAQLGWRLMAAGALLVLGPWLVRALLARGSEQTRLTNLPSDSGASLLSRLYPEPDGALAAAGLLGAMGGLKDPQSAEFASILRQAYARTEPAATMFPTPAIATYLGLQSSSSFDAIVIRPPVQRVAADAAVVFLHGYAGSFYVYCWEMAQAAAAANLLTLCPSLGRDGKWELGHGNATLKATLEYAHNIGMNRIYLAGLSNGAAGAGVLALEHHPRLAGLVLISGTSAGPPASLPTLVVQGSTDQMMPPALARAYAARSGRVSYREIAGGHFIFLSEHDRVRPLIAQFLSELEKRATALPRR
jgi:pimeloyl-ACP methyl ester carboxylesterase